MVISLAAAAAAAVQWQTLSLDFTDGNGLTWAVAQKHAYQVNPQEILPALPGYPTPPTRSTTAAGCS
jgi:hypothetical protein